MMVANKWMDPVDKFFRPELSPDHCWESLDDLRITFAIKQKGCGLVDLTYNVPNLLPRRIR
jgi:hypothetical protein